MAYIRCSGNIGGSLKVRTASGNPCTFTTDLADALVSLTADIVCGGGGGTPSTPIPIVGHSELNLVRCGKNLATLEQGSLNISNGAEITSTTRVRTNFIKVEAGQTYIATSQNDGWSTRNGVAYDSEKNYINYGIWPDEDTGLLTIPSGVAYVRFIYSHNNTSEDCSPSDFWYQFEKGSTATPYAPYNGQTFTVAFGQTVYGGVLDVTRGKLHVTWGGDDLGSLNWEYVPDTFAVPCFRALLTNCKLNMAYAPEGMCSNYPIIGFNISADNDKTAQYSNSGYLYVINTDYTNATTFKSAMSGEKIVYPLETPFDIDRTPEVISAVVGTNNVFADCGGDVNVSYLELIRGT